MAATKRQTKGKTKEDWFATHSPTDTEVPSHFWKADGQPTAVDLRERYIATFVAAAAADAIGFHGGSWEFNRSGRAIHEDLSRITSGRGVKALTVAGHEWRVSDDTVMHIATGQALATGMSGEALYREVARRYKECMPALSHGRSPGMTCIEAIQALKEDGSNWAERPYTANDGGGCGAAMRAPCIGLRFWREEQLRDLVACAVECGRITHHNAAGYLGSVAAAYFTSLAVRRVDTRLWGQLLLSSAFPAAEEYVRACTGRFPEQNASEFAACFNRWREYLKIRSLESTADGPLFPIGWRKDIGLRDEFYEFLSLHGNGGSGGIDCTMVALDAVLFAGHDWETLILVGALHGGDSDSTGHLAGAFWGALHGLGSVPSRNFSGIEFGETMAQLGSELCRVSNNQC